MHELTGVFVGNWDNIEPLDLNYLNSSDMKRLALKVFMQAYTDATDNRKKANTYAEQVRVNAKSDALNFMKGKGSAVKEIRRFWCTLADVSERDLGRLVK
jgi:hypothetical protein